MGYNCSTNEITITNAAFTVDPVEITFNFRLMDDSCTGTTTPHTFVSGEGMTYEGTSVTFSADTIVDGDGIYYYTYTYNETTYTGCVLVLCDKRCEIYNFIAEQLKPCNCQDRDIDKAYKIFMMTQAIDNLVECESCCTAQEVYSNLLDSLNDCTTC